MKFGMILGINKILSHLGIQILPQFLGKDEVMDHPIVDVKNPVNFQMTRRGFLKVAGTGLTAATLGNTLLDFAAWEKEVQASPVEMIPTQCNGCGNRCGIFAYVKNGRIWKIEGNPEANGNLGLICSKGHGYIHDLYSPQRLKGPLKRVGNRFEPISWEQAYQEIAQKINLILLESGPQSLFWVNFPQANNLYALRLMHAMGSPHYFTHGSTCYTARNAGWKVTVGQLPSNDLGNSKYIMIIGRNPAGGIDLAQVKKIVEAKEKGAKVVVIDPRHSETSILADEWLAIKPGTDLALLLSMIHVMIKEGLYDKEFVKNKTVGFQELEDETVYYPPEWAEKVCEIPAKTIVRITREMAQARPKALLHRGYHGAFGSQYLNSFQTARALAITNSLLGNINREGGIYFPKSAQLGELQPKHPAPELPKVPKADGTGVPGRYPLGSYGDGITHAIPELALRGELKAGFVYHNNPLRTNPNPKRVIAGYRKLDLLVVVDTVLSETASIAHYVLPESFYLERDEAVDTRHSGKRAQVSLQQQTVKPLYDTRPGTRIIIDLAKHLGVGKFFEFDLEEANRLRLQPFGVTLEELKKKGMLFVGEEWKEGFDKLETPSGKIEIYSKSLEGFGFPPIPRWEEPLVSPDPKDPHSFRLLHGKQAIHTHSMTANQPYLMEITRYYDMVRLWMNTKRAEALGIMDGDEVTVESEIGKGRIHVRLTEGIHPSAVWLPSGYGIFSKNLKTAFNVGLSYNDFVPTLFDPAVGHAMASEVIVKIKKA
ncbi:MAG: molybdopterin oxidoreductase [Deltaproteobacteria bacterium]|nr:molybdopterin oxidoreductase [Deltaproteobacteria bacterium]